MLPDRGPTVFIVALVTFVLATAMTILRLVSKWVIVKNRRDADDYLTLLAWVLSLAVSVSVMEATRHGLGMPDALIPTEDLPGLHRATYAFTTFYWPSLLVTKTAILLLYIRMSAAHPHLRYASYFTLFIVNTGGVVLTLLSIFQCRPISSAWNGSPGHCIDVISLYLSSAPINILTDLAILLLPLPILTALRLEFRQKVLLVATFITGGFVAIVDIVRIAYLQDALKEEVQAELTGNGSLNTLYHVAYSLMFSAMEVNVGLMCCCALVMKPLLVKLKLFKGVISRRVSTSVTGITSQDGGETRPRLGSRLASFTGREKDRRESQIGQTTITSMLSIRTDGSARNGILGQQTSRIGLEDVPEHAETDDGSDDDGNVDFFAMLAEGSPKQPTTSSFSPVTRGESRLSDAANWSPKSPNMELVSVTEHPVSDQEINGITYPSPPGRYDNGFSAMERKQTALSFAPPQPIAPSPQMPSFEQEPTQRFFDFVDMTGKKPLTELNEREAFVSILFVSVLFLLWGFSYGLLATINGEIQTLLRYSDSRSMGLHGAYWTAYVVSPLLVGYFSLTRLGFKSTFILGLCFYACGAMSFWPSSVLKSYAGFFISNFLAALGLALLEVAANPFIALAGPGHLSEARLNFSQGIQGIGSIISPIIARKLLFRDVTGAHLFDVEWLYLAVALFVVILAVIFFYVPLSECSAEELQRETDRRMENAKVSDTTRQWRMPVSILVLASSATIMWVYVGAQENVSYYWGSITQRLDPGTDSFQDQTAGHCVFAFGRFLAAFVLWLGVPARIVLAVYISGAFICTILTFALPIGIPPLAFLILLLFFESAIFPTLFALALRNQGKHTKLASVILTMAISGGAVWPAVTYAANLHNGPLPRGGISITLALYGVALIWIIAVNLGPQIKRWLDPRWSRPQASDLALEDRATASVRSVSKDLASMSEHDHVEVKGA